MANSNYSLARKVLHWLSAIVVIGLFASGVWMVDLGYYDAWYQTAPAWHVNVGVVLFFATLIRLMLQAKNPPLNAGFAQKIAARFAHISLLLCIVLLTLTGYGLSTADGRPLMFLGLEIPGMGELIPQQSSVLGDWHEIIAYAIIGLSLLHSIAAIKHHWIDRDETLKRMLFTLRRSS
jgi:cytochrome b561